MGLPQERQQIPNSNSKLQSRNAGEGAAELSNSKLQYPNFKRIPRIRMMSGGGYWYLDVFWMLDFGASARGVNDRSGRPVPGSARCLF